MRVLHVYVTDFLKAPARFMDDLVDQTIHIVDLNRDFAYKIVSPAEGKKQELEADSTMTRSQFLDLRRMATQQLSRNACIRVTRYTDTVCYFVRIPFNAGSYAREGDRIHQPQDIVRLKKQVAIEEKIPARAPQPKQLPFDVEEINDCIEWLRGDMETLPLAPVEGWAKQIEALRDYALLGRYSPDKGTPDETV